MYMYMYVVLVTCTLVHNQHTCGFLITRYASVGEGEMMFIFVNAGDRMQIKDVDKLKEWLLKKLEPL